MPLTPLDIHNKDFHKGFRGYSEDEVDEFLDEVVRDYETVLRERDQLREQVSEVSRRLEQYRQMEENLQKALLVAQTAADEVRANAHKEAELILREAETKADRVMVDTKERSRGLERDLAEKRRELQAFRAKMRSIIEAEMRLLDEVDREEGVAEAGQ